MNKNIIDKYDILFSSSIDFTFRVGLYKKQDILGASDNEIKLFCERHNIQKFPAILWSYTRHFGKKANIRYSNRSIAAHTMADFDYAIHQANLKDEWNGNLTLRESLNKSNPLVNYDYNYPIGEEGMYTPPIKSLMNIEDIVFFSYEPFDRSYKFVDGSKENPEIFHLSRSQYVSSLFTSFSNRFRDILFMYIASYAGEDFVEMAIIDGKLSPVGVPPVIDYSSGLEFIKEYQEIFKRKDLDTRKIKSLRQQFYQINNEVEKKENRILSFNEFEENFINFLHKEL